MARAALKLSVRDVASAAKVSPNTVTKIEAGLQVNNSTAAAVRLALEAAGVEFIAENGGGPGVRLRKPSAPKAAAISDEAALPEMPDKDSEPYDGSPI
jgi:transcriptional regulator with XRE-family HTH domain